MEYESRIEQVLNSHEMQGLVFLVPNELKMVLRFVQKHVFGQEILLQVLVDLPRAYPQNAHTGMTNENMQPLSIQIPSSAC